MEKSKILTPDRLSFIKNVSHFSNYDTRIMRFILPPNHEQFPDYPFISVNENKFFFALYSSTPTDVNTFQQESENVQHFEHPSLNKLIAIGSNSNSDSPNSIVSALYKDIPYFTIASKIPTLTHTQKIIILYGIASALKYLQTKNIYFYNLDSSKMYLNRQNEPIIDGYGFSCFQPNISDIAFVAPELLSYINYHKDLHNNNQTDENKNDSNIDLSRANIYAFGHFMIEVITERKPILLRKTQDQYFYSYPINLSKQYDNIISNCICSNPEQRWTFDIILENLNEIVVQNSAISQDLFKLYTSKFSDVRYVNYSENVFNYPLTCFLKPDNDELDDNFFNQFNLDETTNTKPPVDKDTNTNENTNHEPVPKTDENSNPNKSDQVLNNDTDQKANDMNTLTDVDTKEDQDTETNAKRVTMPSSGVPKIRFRQFSDQVSSARNKQYKYGQINGYNQYFQNSYDNTNPLSKHSSVPGTSRPRQSLNLVSMYTRSSNNFNQNTNANSNITNANSVPLLSFREFQMRMFPQEQVPNISFITTENDIEILKKRNDPDSQYILGYYYETKDKFEEAFELYKNASLRGHSQALYREGLLLMNGRGCRQNMKKASKLFLQSAKQRNTDAAYQFILIHGQRQNDGTTEERKTATNRDQNEIKMPKEPSTTRTGKSARNNKKCQGQNPIQSARAVKKSFDDDSSEFNENETSKKEIENDTFTLESTSNQSTSSEATNSTETKGENQGESEAVDIDHELKICMQHLQYCADIGFADSMFKLAILYEQGISYPKDMCRAFSMYKRAADRGVTEACFRAATMMLEGRGTSRAFNEAAFYLQKAARKGHVDALFKCGQLFENGLGVTKNIEKAAEFYREASTKGHTESKRHYARIIHETSRNEKKKKAKNNNTSTEQQQENNNNVEARYTPIVNDEKLAFKLMKEAADEGDVDALTELGEMYRDGFGTSKNLRNAFVCFNKASSSKLTKSLEAEETIVAPSSSCLSNSGLFCHDVENTSSLDSIPYEPKNNNKSGRSGGQKGRGRHNQNSALNNNHFYNDIVNNSKKKKSENNESFPSSSCSNIFDGCGGTIYSDYLASSRSAPTFDLEQKPSARACVNIGLMYEQGLATQIDLKKAVSYFKMSAEMKDPLGQFHYARALENGVGVHVDLPNAAKYYRLSANQGFDRAQFNIARYLEFGTGIKQDKSLAIQFYKCAARQGNKAAEAALKRFRPYCL